MSEMVERVAKALAKEDGLGRDYWKQCIPAARAAIAAMREPTEAMLAAGMKHEGVDLRSEYIAMIDEALK